METLKTNRHLKWSLNYYTTESVAKPRMESRHPEHSPIASNSPLEKQLERITAFVNAKGMLYLVKIPIVSKQELGTMEMKRGFAHSTDHIRARQSLETSPQTGWIRKTVPYVKC